jgi:outer membrane protein OmpA-like peptidoglycan-associated protein/tetratricopeptide (TPR) repeat protein
MFIGYTIKKIVVTFICLSIANTAFMQEFDKADLNIQKQAMKAFSDEDFPKAHELFFKLYEKYPDNFEFNYYIGACYLNTRYNKVEAIPFLKKAVEEGESFIPAIVHKDLGDLNHMAYSFDKAIYHYLRFLTLADKYDDYSPYCERMIEVCKNAKEQIKDTINLAITNIGKPVNSDNSEFAPYVSTDDSILFFTRKYFYSDEELESLENPDTVNHIYHSYYADEKWSEPSEIEMRGIPMDVGVLIAGMSPDGEYLYINAENNKSQDIYVGRYTGKGYLDLELMPEPINSKFWEGKITISHDGNTLWFASNRPGGIGGKDIYKSTKNIEGNWTEPVNMGAPINTIYDEDTPFIHPSGSLFYFSSKGHNTMGGYDIFSIVLDNDKLLFPENMGFPINTVADDSYFVLSANGKTGYFSSSYGNRYQNHDLYQIRMNLDIPLTLVKGQIRFENNQKEISTKIRVIDNETGKQQRYIYNPNPVTGRYLMIFPPGKNYKMIVEAEGFLPKTIDIYIPNQAGFYELFQNIYMAPIVSAGITVGEQLKVENVFFETKSDSVPKDYSLLFEAIDAIIEGTDSLDTKVIESRGFEIDIFESNSRNDAYNQLFKQIDDAFDKGDMELLNEINNEVLTPDRYDQVYFFSDQKNNKYLEKITIGEDTILATPKLMAFGNRPKVLIQKNDLIQRDFEIFDSINDRMIIERPTEIVITPLMMRRSDPDNRKTILAHNVFFDVGEIAPNKVYNKEFDELAKLMINNKQLGIIITGYADTDGTVEKNKILSQNRAITVLEILGEKGVNLSKAIIIAKGGEIIVKENTERERAYNRRVEMKIFELIVDEYK